jgi:hypothetical protein
MIKVPIQINGKNKEMLIPSTTLINGIIIESENTCTLILGESCMILCELPGPTVATLIENHNRFEKGRKNAEKVRPSNPRESGKRIVPLSKKATSSLDGFEIGEMQCYQCKYQVTQPLPVELRTTSLFCFRCNETTTWDRVK